MHSTHHKNCVHTPCFKLAVASRIGICSGLTRRDLHREKLPLPQVATSELGGQGESPCASDSSQTSTDGLTSRQACAGSDPKSREDCSSREPKPHGLQPTHRPPSALLDEQWNPQFLVDRILQRRRRHGQYQVKWRGYPESENICEYEMPLRQYCPYAVDVFERHGRSQLATTHAFHQ